MNKEKYVSLGIYLSFLAVLTSIAIWDVSNIVSDYFANNQMTSVSINYIKNCSTLLHEPIVVMNYNFRKSLFRDSWSLNDSDVDAMNKNWVHRRDLCKDYVKADGSNISLPALSLQDRMDIVQLDDIFWNLDMSNTKNGDLDNIARDNNVTRSQLDETLNAFSSNPECVESLLERLWAQEKENFVDAPDTGGIHVWSIGRTAATFQLKLRDDMRNTIADSYVLDRRRGKNITGKDPARSGESMDLVDKYAASIQVVFRESFDYRLDIPDGQISKVVIQISNAGVFDDRQFPPCSSNYSTKEECLDNLEAQTFADVCVCVPFKDRARLQGRTHPDGRRYSYCTIKDYDRCREKALNETVRRKEAAQDSCTPCVVVKNNYFTSVNTFPILRQPPGAWYERTQLAFTCLDQLHTLYTQEVRYSVPQLISQVGGDLGLYIGFSMLSLMSLCLFIFGLYRHRHTSRSYKLANAMPLPYGIRFALHFMQSNTLDLGGKGVIDIVRENSARSRERSDSEDGKP